jgi:D-alanyl-D-alanine carboxypeptidase
MKKLVVFTILILSLLLAACSGGSKPATVEPTMAPATEQPAEPTAAPAKPITAPVETASVDMDALTASPWQWVSFTSPMEQYTVENPQSYLLTFNADGTVNIVADCNNAIGSYTTDGSSISIEMGPMTKAACPPESRSDDFVKYLGSAAIYFFQDGHLFIDLIADSGTTEFAPAQSTAASLTSNGWRWELFTSPVEQLEIPEPNKYTVTFLDSSDSVVISADCNTLLGTYTVEGQSLKIELGPTTLASCSLESLSDRFLTYLEAASIYTLADGRLLIDLAADGGTLEFGVYDPKAAQQELFRVNSWDEALDRAMGKEACDAPGGVLLADTPQGRYFQARGLASTEDGTSITTGDAFEIGSNTKSFTTVLALQLQEEGVWSLDDPLIKYLPVQAAKLPYGDQVTLRQLAQNNSGIADYADPLMGGAIQNDTIEKGYTPEELVDYVVQNLQPSFEPGQDWEYSTTNFILLGMAAETVTGKSLGELYQERIFQPLEMTKSFLLEGVPGKGQIVQGYYTDESGKVKNVTAWNGSQGWAGGSIVSTAEDMAKYAAGLSSGAVFKDPASLEQLLAFGDGVVAFFDGYGLGVGRFSREPFAWGHAGQTPGFQTLWAVYPDQDSRVVFLTNSGSCNVVALVSILNASPDLFTQELP